MYNLHTREWIVVTPAAGVGGTAATLFAEAAEDVESVSGPPTRSDRPQWCRLRSADWECWEILLNVAVGGIASFILWATYTSHLICALTTFTPAEIGTALAVGLGRIGAVRGFMRESANARKWRQTTARSAEAAETYKESLGEVTDEAPDSGEDTNDE